MKELTNTKTGRVSHECQPTTGCFCCHLAISIMHGRVPNYKVVAEVQYTCN